MGHVRGGVERRAVVPDGDIIETPFVPHLQVVVLRDVAEEVVQQEVRLLGMQLQDPLGEAIDTR